MTSVFLPVLRMLALGGTLNMFKYDDWTEQSSIFQETDVITRPENTLNISYYVMEQDKIPYSAMRLPIDLVHRIKTKRYPSYIDYNIPDMVTDDPVYDRLILVVIAEYTTAVTSIKENAKPVSKWKEHVPDTSTHYAAEQAFGSRCIGKIEIRTGYPGDIQVVRRIFYEVMGSSSQAKKRKADFLRLWKKAIHAARRSPDVRSKIRLDEFKVKCTNANLPTEDARSFRRTFKHLANLGKFTTPYSAGDQQDPIWVSFEPLHSLDKQYPELKINKQSEKSLINLDEKLVDLQKVINYGYKIPKGFTENQMSGKKDKWRLVESIKRQFRELASGDISIYKDLDGDKFYKAFDRFSKALEEGEKSFFSAWKKLHERQEMTCGMKFQRPTTGILAATHLETSENDRIESGGLKQCKQNCRMNDRCRAIQFDEKTPNRCDIYYVSTNTAGIIYDEDDTTKIYDRKCQYLEVGQVFGQG